MSSAAVTVWRGLGHPPRRPQLCVWMAMYPGGGPRDWTLASLTGPRGSPGPQTPGSQPACDTGRQRLSARLLWRLSGDFTDSDSDDFEEAEGRYFRLSQQSRCPDFFLFLCRLLSPVLKAFAQAAAFLHQGRLPDTESGYAEQLFQFLRATAQEEGLFECADPNLAISAIWTFRDLGVLQQMPGPAGPLLHLSPAFASRDSQERLQRFIQQFICS